ncbi:MAG: hypothetical protein M3N49_03275, partial [Candidatus Eremiobacteraeota bacterium]|nr:hypothetical protein [Candidatus Eremiobacteraeota bacterium]
MRIGERVGESQHHRRIEPNEGTPSAGKRANVRYRTIVDRIRSERGPHRRNDRQTVTALDRVFVALGNQRLFEHDHRDVARYTGQNVVRTLPDSVPTEMQSDDDDFDRVRDGTVS